MGGGGVVGGWGLATAAVLVGAVSWRNWRKSQQEEATMHLASPPSAGDLPANDGSGVKNHEAPVQGASGSQRPGAAETVEPETLLANNEMNDFTLLPGVLPADTDEATI